MQSAVHVCACFVFSMSYIIEEWALSRTSGERVNILEGHAASGDCSFRLRDKEGKETEAGGRVCSRTTRREHNLRFVPVCVPDSRVHHFALSPSLAAK